MFLSFLLLICLQPGAWRRWVNVTWTVGSCWTKRPWTHKHWPQPQSTITIFPLLRVTNWNSISSSLEWVEVAYRNHLDHFRWSHDLLRRGFWRTQIHHFTAVDGTCPRFYLFVKPPHGSLEMRIPTGQPTLQRTAEIPARRKRFSLGCWWKSLGSCLDLSK
jgi:hypothetical protein